MQLSKTFEKVIVVFRAHKKADWDYPENVYLVSDDQFIGPRAQEKAPIIQKLRLFVHFTIKFLKTYRKYQPDVLLIYDALAVLSFNWIRKLLNVQSLLWYHNHDKMDAQSVRKYSLSRQAIKAEKALFKKWDLFTLPALERKVFFPMADLKGRFVHLPNYPALSFYSPFRRRKALDNQIKLVYQGLISEDHGLEEIISFLDRKVQDKTLKLTLYGPIREDYQKRLWAFAQKKGVEDKLFFAGFISYKDLPAQLSEHHIGLSILTKEKNPNHATAGTASNKTFEYSALGLPVLFFKTNHFNEHLGKYAWAFATDLSPDSLLDALEKIISDYQNLSETAYRNFKENLNFEHCFKQALDHLRADL